MDPLRINSEKVKDYRYLTPDQAIIGQINPDILKIILVFFVKGYYKTLFYAVRLLKRSHFDVQAKLVRHTGQRSSVGRATDL